MVCSMSFKTLLRNVSNQGYLIWKRVLLGQSCDKLKTMVDLSRLSSKREEVPKPTIAASAIHWNIQDTSPLMRSDINV